MKKHLKSIESKILFWLISITLLTMIVIIFQGYHCSKQAIEETKSSQLLSILSWKKGVLDNQFNEIDNQLKMLSILNFFDSNHEDDEVPTCHKFGCNCNPLTHIEESKEIFNNIKAYDLNGVEISNSKGGDLIEKHKIDKSLIDKIKKSEKVLYFKKSKINNSVFATTTLVNTLNNKINGYVVAEINILKLYKNVLKEAPNFGKSGDIFFVDNNNMQYVYDNTNNKIITKKSIINSNDLKNKKVNSLIEMKLNNKENLIVFNHIKQTNSYILIKVEKKETLKWIGILVNRSLITGFISFIFVIIIGIMISKKLSKPLKELANVSSEIISGNLKARVPDLDTKEAYEVGTGFNSMLDKLMKQSKELAKASSLAAIGELSSSIVHEMRNPLSSVKMNVQAIKHKLKGDPTYEELAEIAEIQVGRLDLMLTELLNFGKPFSLNYSYFFPLDLVHESVDLISTQTISLKQNVVITSEINNDLKIKGDKEYLTRALTNLIKNASEVTGVKGKINITISKKDKYNLLIKVEDMGKGITDAIKDMIFKPFFTTKDNGTGLGLANVKKIIEYHEGKVYFKNNETIGTTFFVELPIEEELR